MKIPTDEGYYIYPQPANNSDPDWAGAQIEGLTLRDHFAGLAMQGMMREAFEKDWEDGTVAKWSYDMADAMIAVRKETS